MMVERLNLRALPRLGGWHGLIAGAAILLACSALTQAAHAAPGACEGLAGAHVPATAITQVIRVAAGTAVGGTVVSVPVCRVVAVVSTKPGEQVGIEVWLPVSGWNGRFEGLGSGGFGGSIRYPLLAPAVARGFAAATTDTGHVGAPVGAIGQALPWVQNPVTLRDWGKTSVHLMTDSAKAIIKAYYGQAAEYSYFDGCSTGGAEAMEEAELFPQDYDGIHAGTPGMDYSHLMMSFLWGGLLPARDAAAALPPPALTLLSTAVLQECGGDQAVANGFLDDPRSCRYDPARLLCQAGQAAGSCLTAPQVAEAKALYSPVRDPVSRLQLYPGFARGSESQWALIQGALVPYFAQPLLANSVFGNPNWDWTTFDFHADAALVDQKLSPVINAVSPDLSGFRGRGGRLIMAQGWADPLAAQTLPIEYYDSVTLANRSLEGTASFFRLFMAPGMGHCGGGPGPNTVGGDVVDGAPPLVKLDAEHDLLTALQDWVEHSRPPQAFTATKYVNDTPAAGVRLERLLCPYPQLAQYDGTGDRLLASSFHCITDYGRFAEDVAEEELRILSSERAGNPQNLPN